MYGENVNVCVKCSCPTQDRFSTVFRFRVCYCSPYFAETVHKVNVSESHLSWIQGLFVCDTKEWINGLLPNVYGWASIMSFVFILYWAKHPKVVIVVGSGSWKSSKLADCIRVGIWGLKLLADIHGRFIPCSYQTLKQVIKKDTFHYKQSSKSLFAPSGTIDQQIYIFLSLRNLKTLEIVLWNPVTAGALL